jgi:hypothetical protein
MSHHNLLTIKSLYKTKEHPYGPGQNDGVPGEHSGV